MLNLRNPSSVARRAWQRPVSVLACALLFCQASAVTAQPANVRISGSVVDPLGHVLPGANVTLHSAGAPDTPDAILAWTTTDLLGRFTFDDIAPGAYVVAAELPGYARTAEPSGPLAGGRSVELTLALGLAPVSEIVNVAASTGAGEPVEA